MKSLRLALLACCLCGGLVSVAWAQRDERRDDGERRDGDSRRGGFDPKEILRRIDQNGNGTIEPSELSDRSRDFVGRLAKSANLDSSQPLSVEKLIGAYESGSSGSSSSSSGSSSGSNSSGSSSSNDSSRDRDRDRERSDRDRDRDRDRERSSSSKTPMSTMAFGVPDDKTPKAAGFDVPLSVDTTIPLEKRYDQRVIEYVDRMLKDYDKNRDGYVDSVEWKEGRWSTPPEESDTNKDNKLSRAELCERIARRFGLQNSPPGGSSSSSGSGSSSPSSSSSSNQSGDAGKIRGWAEGMVKQHDKNKNGVLDRDEWGELRSEHRDADADKDGKITVDELVLKLQAYTTSSSTTSSSSSYNKGSSSSSGSSDRKWSWGSRSSSSSSTKPGERKDYKLQSAIDKLPKGLPDWFLRNDADADGQIAMVEYAVTWNDATAAEFLKYDLDGDGFITPAEVLTTTQPVKK